MSVVAPRASRFASRALRGAALAVGFLLGSSMQAAVPETGTAAPHSGTASPASSSALPPPLAPLAADADRVLLLGRGRPPSAEVQAALAAVLGGPLQSCDLVHRSPSLSHAPAPAAPIRLPTLSHLVLVDAADAAAMSKAAFRAGRWCLGVVPPRFDPGLLAPLRDADPAAQRDAIDVAWLSDVPLLIAVGEGGVLSDPLGLTAQRALAPVASGPRLLVLPGQDARAWCWPDIAALPIPTGTGIALGADASHLRCAIVFPDDANARARTAGSTSAAVPASLVLSWAKPGVFAAPDKMSLRADEIASASAVWLDRLALCSAPTLAGLRPGADAMAALAARAVTEPAAQRLTQRLALIPGTPLPAALPEAVLRQLALRDLAVPAAADAERWRSLAEAGDGHLLRALLRAQEAQAGLLVHVASYLERCAAGRALLPVDALDQHRLTAAVFDAPTLSPTPLRAVGRDLLARFPAVAATAAVASAAPGQPPRLHALARGPVQRFLDRVGVYRAADPVPGTKPSAEPNATPASAH